MFRTGCHASDDRSFSAVVSGPLMEEIDVWRTAHLLIKQHGVDASWVAAQRADALLDAGDRVGCAVFIKVWKAVKFLQSDKPREDEAVN